MATESKLCQLNGGCMGCCGHDFISKKLVKEAIKLNTAEFKEVDPSKEVSLIVFRERRDAYDLRHGVCRNLIERDRQLLCPLHPALNNKKDLRVGHCDLNYMCPSAKMFETWTKEKQNKFMKFIESKKLDNISYSMKMGDNSLLQEFDNLQ